MFHKIGSAYSHGNFIGISSLGSTTNVDWERHLKQRKLQGVILNCNPLLVKITHEIYEKTTWNHVDILIGEVEI